MTDPNQVAAKALREAADALDPDHAPVKGMNIDAMIAGREAEVRALGDWAEAQANSGRYPEVAPTLQQTALGLRANETMVDGQIVPREGQEDR